MKLFSISTARPPAPGYAETRRTLIVAAPCALAACLASPRRLLAATAAAESDDTLADFITDSNDEALALKADASAAGQDEYLRFIARAIHAINDAPQDSISSRSWKGFDPGVYLGDAGRNRAFFVVHWKLAANALLPPHCHPRTSVCTLGLEGMSSLRHFETLPGAPSYKSDRSTEFLIRETVDLTLTPGTTSTLSESRDNIHLFRAGREGARGIDVTTDYGGDGSFSFLEFDHDRPEDSSAKTYVARWIGTDL